MLTIKNLFFETGNKTIESTFADDYLARLMCDINDYLILVALYEGKYTENDTFDGSPIIYSMNGDNLVMETLCIRTEYIVS